MFFAVKDAIELIKRAIRIIHVVIDNLERCLPFVRERSCEDLDVVVYGSIHDGFITIASECYPHLVLSQTHVQELHAVRDSVFKILYFHFYLNI